MVSPIITLEVIAFLDLLAVGLIVPLVAIHIREMGGTHIHIGLLGSIYAIFQLGSGPLIGSLSDIKGRKMILIVTLVISSMAYTSIGFAKSIFVILMVRGILGLFKQTQMLTRTMVPDYERNERKQGEIYGKMMAISGAGMTTGPVMGGHVAEDYPEHGFKYACCIVGICFLINAGLVLLLPNPTFRQRAKRKKTNVKCGVLIMVTNSLKQSFIDLYDIDWSLYWDAFVYKGLVGFAMGVYYSNYAAFLREHYRLSPKDIGYIISFQGVIGTITSYFMGFINRFYSQDKDCSQRNFHVFLTLSTAMFGLILSHNIYLYTFWLIPLAIGNAVGRLITLEMVLIRSKGNHRGKLIGASNSVRSLTGVVSPLVAGLIGEYIGVAYVIYASFLSIALGAVLSYQQKHKITQCAKDYIVIDNDLDTEH